MEVPATSAGVLKEIRVKQGEIAPVSAIVAVIGDASMRSRRPATVSIPDNEVRTPAAQFRASHAQRTAQRRVRSPGASQSKPASIWRM